MGFFVCTIRIIKNNSKGVKMKLRKKFESFTEKTGMINVYACGCGHTVTYIYMDDGVTPRMIRCDSCGGESYSQFDSMKQPARYWYRPKGIKELRSIAEAAYEIGKDKMTVDWILRNYVEHYNNGGLFARMI